MFCFIIFFDVNITVQYTISLKLQSMSGKLCEIDAKLDWDIYKVCNAFEKLCGEDVVNPNVYHKLKAIPNACKVENLNICKGC